MFNLESGAVTGLTATEQDNPADALRPYARASLRAFGCG